MSIFRSSKVWGGIMGGGQPKASPTPSTPATVTPPPGFQTPAGYNVVSVGPGGIPTLRSTTPASNSGGSSGGNYGSRLKQRIADSLIGRYL